MKNSPILLALVILSTGCGQKTEPVATPVAAPAPASAPATAPAAQVAPVVPAPITVAGIPQDEVTRALKEALAKGTQLAIANLGKEGGFLNNLDVKIPMPDSLKTIEKGLRAMKQDRLADEFVTTINRAAEKAVPEAATIFADAIGQMTVQDARAILAGSNDAATQFFRKTSETQLKTKLLPIVQQATAHAGVTASYKNLTQAAGPAAAFLGRDAGDLDAYVTQKSMDGLFKMIAVEEAKIRTHPVARTTALLQKVFGAQR